ncbi:ABC transporter substrate-binding protein [Pendulispora albinea]|uniref:ABC transporter substrate-binding protein n=1 Tax=Pendulispora albinea TaxID=2741071 RepID=A0ABZ2M445_9BACT
MEHVRGLLVAVLAMTAAAGCKEKDVTKEAAPAAQAAAETKLSSAGSTIVLGHVGSLTGNEATFGQSSDRGFKLAIDEQNTKGGIKGKKIELKTLDDQGKPEEAAVAAIRLATQDHVSVIFGEVASTRSLAMAPVAESNHIPMITHMSTNPKVTKDGDKTRQYVFRTCFIDPFQGTVMAKFTRENLKIDKVAILRDVGSDYSVGLAQFFTGTYKNLGGAIVAEQSYKSGDQDFKAQLTAIKGKNPDAIYVPGYYTEVALIARQARELGLKQPLLGGDGWPSDKLFEIAKGALDGSYYSGHYSEENPAPVVQEFVAKYKTAYGTVPDAWATLAYDTARLTVSALERAKELTGPAIRDALEQTKDFTGVTGAIAFDADHNPIKPAAVLGIEKNKSKFASTVNP